MAEDYKVDGGTLSNFIALFLKNFSMKMNGLFVKNIADFVFSLGEFVVIKMDKLLPKYIEYYNDIVDEEISMADINDSDKVVHVGCGPVPSTSVLIAQQTNACVTGIDKDAQAIKGASSCIQLLNLNEQIQVQHANALDFSIKGFDVIMVSQGVEPRYEILKNVSRSMKAGTKVLFRTVSNVHGELTDSDMILKEFFTIKKISTHEKHGLLISVLLFKK